MDTNTINPLAATIGGGFFGGVLLGYAIKKVVRIATIIVGLFIAGLAFLQYQQIASINWENFEASIIVLTGATASTLNDTLVTSNFGIPLSGSMASGFTVGFMKG